MPRRPYEVLDLPPDYFSGGSFLTNETNDGLLAFVQGVAERAPQLLVDATRELVDTDEGVILEVDPQGGSVDIELPAGLPVGFYAEIRQIGTGTVRIIPVGGTTTQVVASAASPIVLAEQFASAMVSFRTTAIWFVTGQLTVA